MKIRKNLIFFILFSIIPLLGHSQLVITNNGVAASLAQAIVGNGITVTNATIDCGVNSTGTFTYTGGNLGIPNGVLLTSGLASDVANPGTYFSSVQNGNNISDPDVVAISSQARYDACLLEFDFIPVCDTLHITYVFGSEEYPQYIMQYNDVFAMFLSGPDPAGGNYVSHNIATLPNGTTPVSIFTVNGGWPIGTGASNPAYYVDNFTNPNTDICYNGYTVPITSVIAVVPCQTYHMKIVVVDALNGRYDSGVFIQGNTFTCNVAPAPAIASTPACINTGTASVTVTNYTGTPNYLWIPGGQTTSSINNLTPGDYTCLVSYPGLCTVDSLTTTVTDGQPIVVPMAGTTICIGQTVSLTAFASGGASGFTYAWTAGGLPVGSNVSPTVSTTYTVIATDAVGCNTPPKTVDVTVNPPLNVLTSNNTAICEFGSTTLSATAGGGDGNLTYAWFPTNGLSDPTIADPVATPATSTIYTVTVTDNCGTPAASSTVTVTIEAQPEPLITANILSGCAPLCVTFTDTSLTSCSTANWSFGDGASTIACLSATHCYDKAGTYTIKHVVTSAAGCVGTGTQRNFITVLPQPKPSFSYWPNPVLITDPEVQFTDKSTDAVSWEWSFSSDASDTSTLKNPQFVYRDTGCYPLQLIVKSQYGCTDTTLSEVCVEMEYEFYAPNAFTPNGDGINEIFQPLGTGVSESDYEFYIFDRWGSEIFKSTKWGEGWDGKVKGGKYIAQEGTYVWLVRVYDVSRDLHEYRGKVTLIK